MASFHEQRVITPKGILLNSRKMIMVLNIVTKLHNVLIKLT